MGVATKVGRGFVLNTREKIFLKRNLSKIFNKKHREIKLQLYA